MNVRMNVPTDRSTYLSLSGGVVEPVAGVAVVRESALHVSRAELLHVERALGRASEVPHGLHVLVRDQVLRLGGGIGGGSGDHVQEY